MTSFITQCPQCRTSFRVSRTQLIAAHGVVRCGACMELFNAARHLQEDERSAGATTTSAAIGRTDPVQAVAAPPPAKPASKDETRWIHDELDLDNLDLDEELAKLERQELELSNDRSNCSHRPLVAHQPPCRTERASMTKLGPSDCWPPKAIHRPPTAPYRRRQRRLARRLQALRTYISRP